MKKKRFIRFVALTCLVVLVFSLSSCAWLSNKTKNIKGELIGNDFTIDFYDNFGSNILTIYGDKVGLEANYVSTTSIDAEGSKSTNYELSSVVTLTVDGKQVAQTGNTIIFAEKGLNKLENFELSSEISTTGGTINILDRNINKIINTDVISCTKRIRQMVVYLASIVEIAILKVCILGICRFRTY